MTWNAQDGGVENQETKATMISVWDEKAMEALRIDLWTKRYACRSNENVPSSDFLFLLVILIKEQLAKMM